MTNKSQPEMDFPYYILMRNMETYARMLETTVDNLQYLTDYEHVITKDRKFKDIPVHTSGLDDWLPVSFFDRSISCNRLRYGITQYACCNNKELQYLIVWVANNEAYPTHNFIVCKKHDLYKIRRHDQRTKIQSIELKEPILDASLIQDVLKNTYLFAKNSRKIKASGIRLRRGVILQGLPGNGKTMLCKYIRALCEKNNISVETVDSNRIRIDYSNQELESTFNSADVIFFDDIDVTFLSRNSGSNGEIATSILAAMDGMKSDRKCVIRIFTTNENTNDLDSAFMRPGRIDVKMNIPNPTADLRERLISSWPKDIRRHININALTKLTEGLSCSQIEEIRSKMTINYYINGDWNYELALEEFEKYNEDFKKNRTVGFRE